MGTPQHLLFCMFLYHYLERYICNQLISFISRRYWIVQFGDWFIFLPFRIFICLFYLCTCAIFNSIIFKPYDIANSNVFLFVGILVLCGTVRGGWWSRFAIAYVYICTVYLFINKGKIQKSPLNYQPFTI